ncbi:MAG: outer membrane beta-barrel protein [Proteobacteria bacterium]|nr:outer membrane beta-barrel protein [Pseudomonadota bacterium]
MTFTRTTLAAAATLCALSSVAVAEDAKPMFAFDSKNLMIRARIINVDPDESSKTSIGGEITADSSFTPELDFTYFWSDHIATELILATSKHDMGAVRTTAGNLDLGDVWILPPTLTLQYHFMTREDKFRPYVGAGINYTMFYNNNASPQQSTSYDNNFGYAFQAGFDYGLNDHWSINADLKKLYLSTDAKVNGTVTASVDLDPWIAGIGLGYRF